MNSHTDAPSLVSLCEHVIPNYAADWHIIGIFLGVPNGELKSIEAGWPTNPKRCCMEMLQVWLDMDTIATWKKINAAINNTIVLPSNRVFNKCRAQGMWLSKCVVVI